MDGTKDPKDPSQVGDPSAGTKGTSVKTPETYTAETEKKAIDDALSAAGRDAKSITDKATEAEGILTDAKKTSDAIKAEREQWNKDRDEAEREAVSGDTEALKSLETKQRQRREKAEIADGKAELAGEKKQHETKVKDDLEQIRVFKRTKLAAEVAVAKGVDVDAILKLAKEDTKEAMEAVAAIILEKKAPLKTDAGTTIGGKALADLSPDEKIKAGLKKNLGG